MSTVRPYLPDELDKLDASIAEVRRIVWRASALPGRVRARLVANLTKAEWLMADCRRALHDGVAPKVADRG